MPKTLNDARLTQILTRVKNEGDVLPGKIAQVAHSAYPYLVAYTGYRGQGGCLVGDSYTWLLYNSRGKVARHTVNVRTGAHTGASLPDGTDVTTLYHCNDITYNPSTGKYYVATLMDDGRIAILDSSFVYESYVVPVDGNGNPVVSCGIAYNRTADQYIVEGNNDFNFYVYDNSWQYVSTIVPDGAELPTRQGIETDGVYIYRTRSDAASVSAIPHPHIRTYTMDGHLIEEYTVEQIAGQAIKGISYDWNNGVFFINTSLQDVTQTNVYLINPNNFAYHAIQAMAFMLT